MKSILSLAIAIAIMAGAVRAGADTIALSNLSGTGTYNTGFGLTTTAWAAVGLTTDASSQQFVSMTGEFFGSNTGGTLEGGIFSDNGSNKPGSLLSAFNNVTVPPGGVVPETITTVSPYQLAPATKYWFVIHDFSVFQWRNDTATNGTTPTAASGYAFDGFVTSSNSGSTWTASTTNYTVQIVTVPEPSTLALAAAGAIGLAVVLGRRRRFSLASCNEEDIYFEGRRTR